MLKTWSRYRLKWSNRATQSTLNAYTVSTLSSLWKRVLKWACYSSKPSSNRQWQRVLTKMHKAIRVPQTHWNVTRQLIWTMLSKHRSSASNIWCKCSRHSYLRNLLSRRACWLSKDGWMTRSSWGVLKEVMPGIMLVGFLAGTQPWVGKQLGYWVTLADPWRPLRTLEAHNC